MPVLNYKPIDNRKTLCFTALQHYMIDLYIEYRNDYLTIQRMAEDYGLSVSCLGAMLDEGYTLHEEYTACL